MLSTLISGSTAAKGAGCREKYEGSYKNTDRYESFPLFFEELTRKLGRGAINDLACAYTAYLYTKNLR